MSYLNQLIRRQAPLTRCQCAVMAVLSGKFAGTDEIWRRGARYAENKTGRVALVAYGTLSPILRSLVQQGFAEKRGGKRPQYRTAKP